MNQKPKHFSDAFNRLSKIVGQINSDNVLLQELKKEIGYCYSYIGELNNNHGFLNYGLYDESLEKDLLSSAFVTPEALGNNLYSALSYYRLIAPLIHQGFNQKTILEVGCGNGFGLDMISSILKPKNCVGIDLSEQVIRRDNSLLQNNIQFIQADAEEIPIHQNSVDLLINIESSHLYPNIDAYFSEVERVLAINGYFCYSDIVMPQRPQHLFLKRYLKKSKQLKLIKYENITSLIQKGVYHRIIKNEAAFLNGVFSFFNRDSKIYAQQFPNILIALGFHYISWWQFHIYPRWKRQIKSPVLLKLAKQWIKFSLTQKNPYFYFLIQKFE